MAASPATSDGYAKIVVIKRNGADGPSYPLAGRECVIGRGTECDIRIQLPNVAYQHCRLDVEPEGTIYVTNMSRDSSTQLNQTPVTVPQQIFHKDVLTIIDRSFRVEFPHGSKQRPGARSSPKKALSPANTPSLSATKAFSRTTSPRSPAMPSTPNSAMTRRSSPIAATPLASLTPSQSGSQGGGDAATANLLSPATELSGKRGPRPKSPRSAAASPVIICPVPTEDSICPVTRAASTGDMSATGDAFILAATPASENKLILSPKTRPPQATPPTSSPSGVSTSSTPNSLSVTKQPSAASKTLAVVPSRSSDDKPAAAADAVTPLARPLRAGKSPPSTVRSPAAALGPHRRVRVPSPAVDTGSSRLPARLRHSLADIHERTTNQPLPECAAPVEDAGSPTSAPQVSTKRRAADAQSPPSKRRRVSFGNHLSPELFDKKLPPATPLKKGATPRRASTDAADNVESPVAGLLKRRSLAAPKAAPIMEESPLLSPRRSPRSTVSEEPEAGKVLAATPTLTEAAAELDSSRASRRSSSATSPRVGSPQSINTSPVVKETEGKPRVTSPSVKHVVVKSPHIPHHEMSEEEKVLERIMKAEEGATLLAHLPSVDAESSSSPLLHASADSKDVTRKDVSPRVSPRSSKVKESLVVVASPPDSIAATPIAGSGRRSKSPSSSASAVTTPVASAAAVPVNGLVIPVSATSRRSRSPLVSPVSTTADELAAPSSEVRQSRSPRASIESAHLVHLASSESDLSSPALGGMRKASGTPASGTKPSASPASEHVRSPVSVATPQSGGELASSPVVRRSRASAAAETSDATGVTSLVPEPRRSRASLLSPSHVEALCPVTEGAPAELTIQQESSSPSSSANAVIGRRAKHGGTPSLKVPSPRSDLTKAVALRAIHGRSATPKLTEAMKRIIALSNSSPASTPSPVAIQPPVTSGTLRRRTLSSVVTAALTPAKLDESPSAAAKTPSRTPAAATGRPSSSRKSAAVARRTWADIVKGTRRKSRGILPVGLGVRPRGVRTIDDARKQRRRGAMTTKAAPVGRTPLKLKAARAAQRSGAASTGHAESPATIVITDGGRRLDQAGSRRKSGANDEDGEAAAYADMPPTPRSPGEMLVSPLAQETSSFVSNEAAESLDQIPTISRLRKSVSPRASTDTAAQKSDDITHVVGAKELLSVSEKQKIASAVGINIPNASKGRKSASLVGVKELLNVPKERKSISLVGVKELLTAAKGRKSTSLVGVKEIFQITRARKSISLVGVKELTNIPKNRKSASLIGVKELLKVPKQSASISLVGVKELVKTPKQQMSPSMVGVKELFQLRKERRSDNLIGVRELMTNPKQSLRRTPSLGGVQELFVSPPTKAVVGEPAETGGDEREAPASSGKPVAAAVIAQNLTLEDHSARSRAVGKRARTEDAISTDAGLHGNAAKRRRIDVATPKQSGVQTTPVARTRRNAQSPLRGKRAFEKKHGGAATTADKMAVSATSPSTNVIQSLDASKKESDSLRASALSSQCIKKVDGKDAVEEMGKEQKVKVATSEALDASRKGSRGSKQVAKEKVKQHATVDESLTPAPVATATEPVRSSRRATKADVSKVPEHPPPEAAMRAGAKASQAAAAVIPPAPTEGRRGGARSTRAKGGASSAVAHDGGAAEATALLDKATAANPKRTGRRCKAAGKGQVESDVDKTSKLAFTDQPASEDNKATVSQAAAAGTLATVKSKGTTTKRGRRNVPVNTPDDAVTVALLASTITDTFSAVHSLTGEAQPVEVCSKRSVVQGRKDSPEVVIPAAPQQLPTAGNDSAVAVKSTRRRGQVAIVVDCEEQPALKKRRVRRETDTPESTDSSTAPSELAVMAADSSRSKAIHGKKAVGRGITSASKAAPPPSPTVVSQPSLVLPAKGRTRRTATAGEATEVTSTVNSLPLIAKDELLQPVEQPQSIPQGKTASKSRVKSAPPTPVAEASTIGKSAAASKVAAKNKSAAQASASSRNTTKLPAGDTDSAKLNTEPALGPVHSDNLKVDEPQQKSRSTRGAKQITDAAPSALPPKVAKTTTSVAAKTGRMSVKQTIGLIDDKITDDKVTKQLAVGEDTRISRRKATTEMDTAPVVERRVTRLRK